MLANLILRRTGIGGDEGERPATRSLEVLGEAEVPQRRQRARLLKSPLDAGSVREPHSCLVERERGGGFESTSGCAGGRMHQGTSSKHPGTQNARTDRKKNTRPHLRRPSHPRGTRRPARTGGAPSPRRRPAPAPARRRRCWWTPTRRAPAYPRRQRAPRPGTPPPSWPAAPRAAPPPRPRCWSRPAGWGGMA